MKKLALYLVAAISTLSCSNAQIKEFSKETMQKELVLPDNNKVTFKDLLKKHKGKVTVIEVWASWCSDCVKAMPKVKEMQANHTNVDFVFISMDKAYDKWLTGIEKHELKVAGVRLKVVILFMASTQLVANETFHRL